MNPRPRKIKLLRWLPRSLMLTRGPSGDDTMYLSFDDGPHPEFTPRLLDLLAAHGAKASFFLVGEKVQRAPDVVRRMVAEGHLIANHSFSHPLWSQLSLADRLAEIARTDKLLAVFDGREQHLFRPPRGDLQFSLLFNFAMRRRTVAYWSYDSLDYQHLPVADLIGIVRRTPPGPGDIVLMHDDSDSAAQMLEIMLPEWAARGMKFRALPVAAYAPAAAA